MATATGEGKSGFLKEFFVDHPAAGKAAIDQAWRDAGHDGSISSSLISKVRSELGLTAQGRSRTGTEGRNGAGRRPATAPKSGGRRTGLKTAGRTEVGPAGKPVVEREERPAETRAPATMDNPV